RRARASRRLPGAVSSPFPLLPGVEQRLDGGDVGILGQLDAVNAGEGRLGRGRVDPVTAEVVVQVQGAADRDFDVFPVAFGLYTERRLLLLGHKGSFLYLVLLR